MLIELLNVVLAAALFFCGVLLSIRAGFPQIFKFSSAFKRMFDFKSGGARSGFSPFQAMTTALSSCVGTGNIAGVALAISSGGPGAVFWMWFSAFFGMATKYCEIFLSVLYQKHTKGKEPCGGPMYYISKCSSKFGAPLSRAFCVFGALAALGIGCLTQVNTISQAAYIFVSDLFKTEGEYRTEIFIICGAICSLLSAVVIIGKEKRIGKISQTLVPFMSVSYILFSLIIIALNAGALPLAFKSIFSGAFSLKAAAGAGLGIGLKQAILNGVSRGVFSNEAGLGSSPIAHGSANAKSPQDESLLGICEVFLDTIVICSLTALLILCSGVNLYGKNEGFSLTLAAFCSVFGNRVANIILFISIVLFAMSTVFGWSFYGKKCVLYLLGEKSVFPYGIIYCCFAFLGAVFPLKAVWSFSEAANALMAIPNLISLIILSPQIKKHARLRA